MERREKAGERRSERDGPGSWSYLQVGLHERSPGLHQVVTDAPLTGGGGFVERRLASVNDNSVSRSTPQDSEGRRGTAKDGEGLTSLSR